MQEQSLRLENLINQAVQTLIHSDIRNWNVRANPDKWSKNELLGHLIDSANNNIQRFVRGTYDENFKVVYHQDEWVKAQHYNESETKYLIHLWQLLNLHIVRILKNYPAKRTKVLCDTGKMEPSLFSMSFLASDYIDHLEHHLIQLTN
jgi:hypothetical protein